MNEYKLILCDPPWSYNDKAIAGNRGAEFKYPCMSIKELADMKDYIDEIAAIDSVLFMWTTAPMLPNAIVLMAEWGYKFKTVAFTWVKTNKNPFSSDTTPNNHLTRNYYLQHTSVEGDEITHGDFMGMGNHTRSNAEFVLLGIRGKGVRRANASIRSTVISPIREHSRKPDEVRKRLEILYGDVTRIELFARERFPNWDSHGNEVGKFN
jgi:N6-adenosine-specific RNA methylase IME4